MGIPSGSEDNDWKVRFWDCDDASGFGRDDNVGFIFRTDCMWGSWSAWSACPVTCGGGTHIRSRTVEVNATGGGKACNKGDRMERGSCGSLPCKDQAKSGAPPENDQAPHRVHSNSGTLDFKNLDPTYTYLTTSRPKVVIRSGTSRARLHITFLFASVSMATYSHSIN